MPVCGGAWGGALGRVADLVAGVAGQTLGPDPTVTGVYRHAMDLVGVAGRAPKRDVIGTHVAIQAARMGQHIVDPVPGQQSVGGRDRPGRRQSREIEMRALLREGDRGGHEAHGEDRETAHGDLRQNRWTC